MQPAAQKNFMSTIFDICDHLRMKPYFEFHRLDLFFSNSIKNFQSFEIIFSFAILKALVLQKLSFCIRFGEISTVNVTDFDSRFFRFCDNFVIFGLFFTLYKEDKSLRF